MQPLDKVFLEGYLYVGYGCKNARAAVSITLIGLAAILTAFKVYDNIAKLPVPVHWFLLPDFPNSIASPAMEFKSEGYVLGLSAKCLLSPDPYWYMASSLLLYTVLYFYIISLF